MEELYLLVVNGKPAGPYSIEELKAMNIQADDFVKTPQMVDYKEAHELAELRAALGFRLQPVTPQYFGAFDQRVLAAIVDWLIVGGALVLMAFVAVLFISDKQTRLILSFSLLVLVPLANLIYHVVMEGSARQATYGKMILKIRVCNLDGSDINRTRAVWRNLAKVCSVLTLCIGYILSFFNKRQQCLHDMIARTLVIRGRLV